MAIATSRRQLRNGRDDGHNEQAATGKWPNSQMIAWALFLGLIHIGVTNKNSFKLINFDSISSMDQPKPAGALRSRRQNRTYTRDENIPYYLQGRIQKIMPFEAKYKERTVMQSIWDSPIDVIPDDQDTWVMYKRTRIPTRNHDNIILDVEASNRQILLVLLGRYSQTIQWTDLQTGKRNYTNVTGKDPAGNDLGNLNHVYSVVVDSLTTPSYKEVWLPCGFHGHTVNEEESSDYARIVNLKTMQVETGPKLPISGGACVAAPIHIRGPDHPAHICMFGGTDGSHNTGTFLPYASCYDREAKKWNHPFGRMPFGFDHGSVVHLPSGICDPDDPERMLIFNYRLKSYGAQRPEIMAFDLPFSGHWSDEELATLDMETPGAWYLYANISHAGELDEVNAPRDASGLAIANDYRNVINFGGVHYYDHRPFKNADGTVKTIMDRARFSTVRSLDVCVKEWSKVGDIGARLFAVQTGVSGSANVAITCGGHLDKAANQNNPWCFVSRIPGVQFQANRGCTVTDDQIPGMVVAID